MKRGNNSKDIHASCRERIATLKAVVAAQQKVIKEQSLIIEELRGEVRELKARLNQSSRNSSKPPSSDPPSVPPRQGKAPTGRKPGGQPGHKGHARELLPPDQVNRIEVLKPKRCGKCGKKLKGEDSNPLRHQVTEVPPLCAQTTEWQRHRLICDCGESTLASLPEGVPKGVLGPRAQALLGYLTGQAHLSKRQIEEIMKDALGVPISLGTVVAAQQQVSEAVAPAVEEVKSYVEKQGVANADETGWKEGNRGDGQGGRKKAWLWVAVTNWAMLFLIQASRGTKAARTLLGQFTGYLGSDRWNAYNTWPVRKRQLCWSHLIRDFAGFVERGLGAARIGKALLLQARKMFELWYRVRDGTLSRSSFRVYMRPIRRRVEALLRKGTRCGEPKTEGMCRMILKLAPALWTFVRVPGVEPTNNVAERAVRPAVLYRKGCFGTQSEKGSRFVERILTVVATLRRQKRNVMEYLTDACARSMEGKKPPSLLPGRAHKAVA